MKWMTQEWNMSGRMKSKIQERHTSPQVRFSFVFCFLGLGMHDMNSHVELMMIHLIFDILRQILAWDWVKRPRKTDYKYLALT